MPIARKQNLPRLYAILDAATCVRHGLSTEAAAGELRDAGVRLLQYRDKVSGPAEIVRVARAIGAAFAGVQEAMLVMNDRADLALLAGWHAVHVGQGDLPVTDALAVLRPHSPAKSAYEWGTLQRPWAGVSTHTEEQVRAANASEAAYVAFGPVFGTATKPDAEPVVGLDALRRARELTQKPLVAIGGITLANCPEVLAAGADSVAVISGLFLPGMTLREAAETWLCELSE